MGALQDVDEPGVAVERPVAEERGASWCGDEGERGLGDGGWRLFGEGGGPAGALAGNPISSLIDRDDQVMKPRPLGCGASFPEVVLRLGHLGLDVLHQPLLVLHGRTEQVRRQQRFAIPTFEDRADQNRLAEGVVERLDLAGGDVRPGDELPKQRVAARVAGDPTPVGPGLRLAIPPEVDRPDAEECTTRRNLLY